MAPLISLALAVKNGMPHLRTALEAVRRQTYSNYELVVQDGGSTDGTLDYLSSVAGIVPMHLVSAPDSGVGQGYNRVLTRCSGDFVCVIASDEYLEDDALAKAVGWCERSPNAVCVTGAVRLANAENRIIEVFESPHFDLLGHLRNEVVLPFAGLLNRKKIGPDFCYDDSLKTCPDYDFWIRLGSRFQSSEFVMVHEVFKTARADKASMSFRPESFDQFCRDKLFVLNRFLDKQPSGPVIEAVRQTATAGIFTWAAESLFQLEGTTPSFIKWCEEAVKFDPLSARLSRLAARSQAFTIDKGTGRLVLSEDRQPGEPLRRTESLRGCLDLGSISKLPHWSGPEIEYGEQVRVHTASQSWAYAATIPLTLPDAFDPQCWYWARIALRVVSGQVGIGLLVGDDVVHEQLVSASQGTTDVFVKISRPDAGGIMIRNGALSLASTVQLMAVGVEMCQKPLNVSFPRG